MGGTCRNQGFTLTVSAGGGSSSNFAYVSGSVTGAVRQLKFELDTINPASSEPGAGHLLICAATWQSLNGNSLDERPE